MPSSILLVHSPLVGPSSWARAADVLSDRGYVVALPDLTGVADAAPPRWRVFVRTAAAGAADLDGDVGVMGHSGAGAFLPAIGAEIGERSRSLTFVDAVVPPRTGAHETPGRMLELLDQQTVDGRLRPWIDWWSEETFAELLPEPEDREALAADVPSLPRSFYDEAVPVPEGWWRTGCAFVQLSDAYEAEYAEAGARGWARRKMDADHLAVRTQPAAVVDAIVSLLDTVL